MTTLTAIILCGVLMSLIALAGSVTTLLDEHRIPRIILPPVALAFGSLIGCAIVHMPPASMDRTGHGLAVYLWLAIGSRPSSSSSRRSTGITAIDPHRNTRNRLAPSSGTSSGRTSTSTS